MKNYILTLFLLFYLSGYSQQNCNIYKWDNNMPCYEACELYNNSGYGQGSRGSQVNYDKIIELCPSYDDAYWAKAIPYLKRGDFIAWKKMIDQAVELAPEKHLGYRGWCRLQFLRDYEGCIKDLEALDSLVNYDIGYCQNGKYHLEVARALSYKEIGQKEKAIQIIEAHLNNKETHTGLFDFLHLGVLYLEIGAYNKSIDALNQQLIINDELAENYYYLALAYKGINNIQVHKKYINEAFELYQEGKKMDDVYTTPIDKIYLIHIRNEYTEASMG